MNTANKELHIFDCDLKGRQLIEASAGTGKTYTITSLYVRLLIEKQLQPSEILVVTFTEAATAELKQRIRRRLKESSEVLLNQKKSEDEFLNALCVQYSEKEGRYLKEMLQLMDEAAIHTIHGFCNRLLTEHSLQFNTMAGFEITTDLSEMIQDCTDQYWRDFMKIDPENDFLQALIRLLKSEGTGPDKLREKVQARLQRPYAKLRPEPAVFSKYKEKFKILKEHKKEIQSVLAKEKESLEAFLFGEALKGNVYHENKKREYYDEFIQWVASEQAELFYFEKLHFFGSKMPQSVKKAFEPAELQIFEMVDEVIALTDELREVKYGFIAQASEQIIKDLQHKKEELGIYSYDDLLTKVDQGLLGENAANLKDKLLRKYPAALVDEFQDTDPVQYRIFHSLYSQDQGECLFMIGDPKQAIYGFRGADIHTYLKARDQASTKDRYGLFHNYRSSKDLIGRLNSLFTHSETPFLMDDLEYYPVSFPEIKAGESIQKNGTEWDALQFVKITCDPNDGSGVVREQVSEAVVNEIVYLLRSSDEFSINGHNLQEKDIAILVRTRYEGQMIRDKLRQRGLFSVLRTGDSVYQSSAAEELYVFLKAVLEPDHDRTVRAALSTDLIGYDLTHIAELNSSSEEWSGVLDSILSIRDSWLQKGIGAALSSADKEFDIQYKLSAYSDAHRRITNFRHLKEILISLEREHRSEPAGILKRFRRKISEPTTSSEQEEIRLENDEDLIQIMTIHASKGLEFPVVFNPFLWDSISPPAGKNGMIYVNRGEDKILDIRKGSQDPERLDNEMLAYEDEASESLRLLYVALTRAEYLTLIYIPEFKDLYLSPLGMLIRDREQVLSDMMNKISNKKTVRTPVDSILQGYDSIVDFRGPSVYSAVQQKQENSPVQTPAEVRQFNRDAQFQYPALVSYSSIAGQISQSTDESAFRDHSDGSSLALVTETKKPDRYTFPKGAKTGNLLHDILEETDFTSQSSLKQHCQEKLIEYGFDEGGADMVFHWMNDCLKTPLSPEQVSLSELACEDTLREMEFHLKLKGAETNQLLKILQKGETSATQKTLKGYLKGYIDLIFRWNNKYYLLDYKSNYLGSRASDYGSEALKSSMVSSSYDLQYHIYTVALDAFLRKRSADYRYSTHFGGVYYLYLRGMDPGSDNGIFFDRPNEEKIQKLREILTNA